MELTVCAEIKNLTSPMKQTVGKSKVEEGIKRVIDVGYSHIDSTDKYPNEEDLGWAIQKISDGTVQIEKGTQEEFFPVEVHTSGPELVQTGLEMSLRKLQLSHVDLYVIHFPAALKGVEKCKAAGMAKSISMYNFNRRQLEKILNKPGLKYKPVCNPVSPTNQPLFSLLSISPFPLFNKVTNGTPSHVLYLSTSAVDALNDRASPIRWKIFSQERAGLSAVYGYIYFAIAFPYSY
ncbi:hypothetical protein HPG69_014154 [Diceros bicornis minor]|uniref:NADP-dependent oxidoreductase domain-containing protein n=1 Tax=Diceros bicornis minor TaxID=77932 RepID=A0A7J7FJZ8_DICBM|nr:hypothetical protein HPG69_014154 [Diceros bicornis minor]